MNDAIKKFRDIVEENWRVILVVDPNGDHRAESPLDITDFAREVGYPVLSWGKLNTLWKHYNYKTCIILYVDGRVKFCLKPWIQPNIRCVNDKVRATLHKLAKFLMHDTLGHFNIYADNEKRKMLLEKVCPQDQECLDACNEMIDYMIPL